MRFLKVCGGGVDAKSSTSSSGGGCKAPEIYQFPVSGQVSLWKGHSFSCRLVYKQLPSSKKSRCRIPECSSRHFCDQAEMLLFSSLARAGMLTPPGDIRQPKGFLPRSRRVWRRLPVTSEKVIWLLWRHTALLLLVFSFGLLLRADYFLSDWHPVPANQSMRHLRIRHLPVVIHPLPFLLSDSRQYFCSDWKDAKWGTNYRGSFHKEECLLSC